MTRATIDLRTFVLLFVAGAIGLTLLDSVHVQTGTLAYSRPVAFGSAWWVPVLMGSAASLGGALFVSGWRHLGGPPALPSRAALWRSTLLFAVMYAASGLLPVGPAAKLVALSVGAAIIFRDLDGTRAGALLTLVGAVGGTTAEAINPHFHYLAPDLLRVPMWLPALYACASPVVGHWARALAEPAPEPAGAPAR